MTFKEILEKPFFELPKRQSTKAYLDVLVDSLALDYLALVESIKNEKFYLSGWAGSPQIISGKFIAEFQYSFIQGIIDSVTSYLDGNPGIAYSTFTNTIDKYYGNFKNLMSEHRALGPTSYYRIRTSADRYNFPFSRTDMFHIPLSSRGKVQTQRFSISGFPSLYISDSLYVCWEELKRPNIDTVHAVRLETTSSLRLLDLSPPPNDNDHERVSYLHFMTWPLTMACSIQVANPQDNFKPEYIIPQLLMQWTREKSTFDGIRYKSNHLPPEIFKSNGPLHNIVLPIATGAHGQKDQCPTLTSKFHMTSTMTWPAYKLSLEGSTMGAAILSSNKNPFPDMPNLELMDGFSRPYHFSILGKMQSILDSWPASNIV